MHGCNGAETNGTRIRHGRLAVLADAPMLAGQDEDGFRVSSANATQLIVVNL